MTPYIQHTPNSCGPDVVACLTGIPFETVLDRGWEGKFKGNDDDSFLHHEHALGLLGYRWKTRTFSELTTDKCKRDGTAVLIKNPSNPLQMHWCIYAGLSILSNGITVLYFYMGKKLTASSITLENFRDNWGPLSVAYEVEKVQITKPLPWWKRAWISITQWW